MGCAFEGAAGDFAEKQGYVEAIEKSDATKRLFCKMAADMYDGCGKETYFQRHFFDVLSKEASWDSSNDEYVGIILEAFGKAIPALEEEERHEKAAGMVSKGMVANLIGRGVASTPEMIKTLAALGVGTGAGVGALSWYLNRDSQEDDQDLEVMRSRIDNYHRITGEITDGLRRNGKLPVTNELKNIVDEQ